MDNFITLTSGIYSIPKLDFDWGDLKYYPTFLELTPPQENFNEWKIDIKYIKKDNEETEKIDNKSDDKQTILLQTLEEF